MRLPRVALVLLFLAAGCSAPSVGLNWGEPTSDGRDGKTGLPLEVVHRKTGIRMVLVRDGGRPFYIGRTWVPKSAFERFPVLPVPVSEHSVAWLEGLYFVRHTGLRLPTPAEWKRAHEQSRGDPGSMLKINGSHFELTSEHFIVKLGPGSPGKALVLSGDGRQNWVALDWNATHDDPGPLTVSNPNVPVRALVLRVARDP